MRNKPNILFFLPDQHRADWLGCNPGLPLKTPNLDKLMKQGVAFSRAYTPSPLCAPARACLASGRNYEDCQVPSNCENYPLDIPTYYQRLRDAGYHVCGVGKFDLHKDLAKTKEELDWYLDGSRSIKEWGFTEGIDNEGKMDGTASYRAAGQPKGPYLNFLYKLGLADIYEHEHQNMGEYKNAYITQLPDDAYCDNWIAENGLEFLRNFPKNQPWHLVVNFAGPHNPMDVTQSMHDAWKDVVFPSPVNNEQKNYTDEDHQRNRQYYAAMIENIDHHIGRFINMVDKREELDNTIIVYSSDHGEMLGDHEKWGKSVPHDPSVHIPLIIAGPEIQQDVISDALVVLQDLTATFLEASGAETLPGMDAVSLLPLLKNETTNHHRETIHIALGNWKADIDTKVKKIKIEGGKMQFFDLQDNLMI
jgi:arylsulfatase A-like enzyme